MLTAGIITYQELQVLEGVCAHRDPQGFVQLLARWRRECTSPKPMRLQTFLDKSGFDRPGSNYIGAAKQMLLKQMALRCQIYQSTHGIPAKQERHCSGMPCRKRSRATCRTPLFGCSPTRVAAGNRDRRGRCRAIPRCCITGLSHLHFGFALLIEAVMRGDAPSQQRQAVANLGNGAASLCLSLARRNQSAVSSASRRSSSESRHPMGVNLTGIKVIQAYSRVVERRSSLMFHAPVGPTRVDAVGEWRTFCWRSVPAATPSCACRWTSPPQRT